MLKRSGRTGVWTRRHPFETLALNQPKVDIGLLVQQESDKCTSDQTNYDWKRYGRCRGGKRYPSNEDYGFKTFSKNGDEWEHEHAVFLAPSLERSSSTAGCDGLFLESFGKFDAPFLLHLRDSQKGSAEDADNQSCEYSKGAFPIVLSVRPLVFTESIEGSNQTAADDQAEEQTECCTVPDLGRR